MAEPVTLADLKLFARIDTDAEDALITSLGVAAREFIEQATGRQFDGGSGSEVPDERVKLAIMSLAAHWYEHREPTPITGTVSQLPMHVRTLIHQLTDWSRICPPEETA